MLTRLDARSKLLLTLSATFVSALLVGDIIGAKLFDAGPTLLSVGLIPFPITFLLTDLLNEFYGKRTARTVTWIGFGMALFTFSVISLAVWIPFASITTAPDWKGVTKPAFDLVFGGSQRMLIASTVAYLFAQLTDIWVFNRLKTATAGRLLWLRATGSTLVSQFIDTVVIQTLAWEGTLEVSRLVSLIASSYATKVAVAVGLTPLVYLGHSLVERVLGIQPVTLNPDGEPLEAEGPHALRR
jgi:uncharacterized integral membrane protein (TIGR00697 family)